MATSEPPITDQRLAELTSAGIPPHYHTYFAGLRLDGLTEKLGIKFQHLSPEYSVATMLVEGNTQVIGLLHGGATAALAETLGSVAAFLSVAEQGKVAVGVDLNITHLRSASRGVVTGVCRSLKLGKTVCVHSVEITDESGRVISTARITNQIIDAPHR